MTHLFYFQAFPPIPSFKTPPKKQSKMSASSTPKGTPVQRSPSDGVPEDLQSPQQSTPGSGSAQQKKRISSLLQSPVRLDNSLSPCLSLLQRHSKTLPAASAAPSAEEVCYRGVEG